jgi:uncharacterized OB-fold protein
MSEKALRPRPVITRDTQFFWDALKDRKLMIQRCADCHKLHHPPTPSCPHCWSLKREAIQASGRATLFTFTVVHKPLVPAFDKPNTVGVLQLEEGTKLVAELAPGESGPLEIGMPVEVDFLDCDPDLTLPVFRPVKEASK